MSQKTVKTKTPKKRRQQSIRNFPTPDPNFRLTRHSQTSNFQPTSLVYQQEQQPPPYYQINSFQPPFNQSQQQQPFYQQQQQYRPQMLHDSPPPMEQGQTSQRYSTVKPFNFDEDMDLFFDSQDYFTTQVRLVHPYALKTTIPLKRWHP